MTRAKELVVDLFSEGDFLGYIPLLENTCYKETAEAIEESELAVIPKEDFEDLINNNQEVTRQFIQLLAKNITEKETSYWDWLTIRSEKKWPMPL